MGGFGRKKEGGNIVIIIVCIIASKIKKII